MTQDIDTQMKWSEVADLQDVIQDYVDKADTYALRSQNLIESILQKTSVLSERTLPALNVHMNQIGMPIVEQAGGEIVALGEDMEDWFETLKLLGEEYTQLKDALVQITSRTIEVGMDGNKEA